MFCGNKIRFYTAQILSLYPEMNGLDNNTFVSKMIDKSVENPGSFFFIFNTISDYNYHD